MLGAQAEPILSRAPQGKMPALVNAFQRAIAHSSAADDPLARNLRLRLVDSRALGVDSAQRAGNASTVRPWRGLAALPASLCAPIPKHDPPPQAAYSAGHSCTPAVRPCLQQTAGHRRPAEQAAGGARVLHPPVVDDWQGLSLEYAVPPPLHVLLTPQASRLRALARTFRLWICCDWAALR